MAINPYSKKTVVVSKTGNELSESGTALSLKDGKVQAGKGAFEDNKGEINAYNKKDLIHRMIALGSAAQQGEIAEQHEFASKRAELVEAAMADATGETWRVVGEVLGDEIKETMGRDGLLRKILMRKDLKKGEIGRVRIRKKDVLAFIATSDSGSYSSQINQSYILPSEFYVKAHILIEDRELEQAPGDLLDDKYIDGLEQLMVKEDQVMKSLFDVAAPSYNDLIGFTTFSPTVFSQARTQIMSWGNPAASAIVAFDLLNDIYSDAEFSTYFDPVTKREIIMSGHLGSLMGTQLITDGYRYETLKVLNQGEFYFVSAPDVVGAVTIRKDVTTAPINLYLVGRPERGWYMQKIMGMTVANGRGIVRGVRV